MNINFQEVQKKWQKVWKDSSIYKTTEEPNKPKYYVLDMFPYPSGTGLHIGHTKGYTATDVIARKKMLEGHNVLHPMGRDAFGLPAENYAIENKVHPSVSTNGNIIKFKKQLEGLGCTYDRDREVNTTDPSYYKRSQWIFLQLYNHYFDEESGKAEPINKLVEKLKANLSGLSGYLSLSGKTQEKNIEGFIDSQRLAFVDYKPINRCPKCKTGLANEDLEGGKCERCGSEVEQKPMKQRVLRITKYAERLLNDIDLLTKRPEAIKEMQRNWIGKSEGSQFKMFLENSDLFFEVYTTRIDTVFGISFVAIAPEHPLLDQITTGEYKEVVNKYKEQANKKTALQRTELEKEKTGVFCGAYAINPFNNEKVPVFVADYVLAGYGTGVVMAVPAHDERDWEFAKKYNLTIKQSVAPVYGEKKENEKKLDGVSVVIFDPKTQQYLLEQRHSGRVTPVSGGCETGEKLIDTAKREMLEESGYYDIKEIIPLNFCFYSRYYHPEKKQNMFASGDVFLVILNSTKQKEKGLEDHEKFDLEWLSADELNEKYLKNNPYLGNFHIVHKKGVEKAIDLGYDKTSDIGKYKSQATTDYGILVDSGEFTGLSSQLAIEKMQERLEKNSIGSKKYNYKLQDRVFSRQRYWGEPIPMLNCEANPSGLFGHLPLSGKTGTGKMERLENEFKIIDDDGKNEEEKAKLVFDVFTKESNWGINYTEKEFIDNWLKDRIKEKTYVGKYIFDKNNNLLGGIVGWQLDYMEDYFQDKELNLSSIKKIVQEKINFGAENIFYFDAIFLKNEYRNISLGKKLYNEFESEITKKYNYMMLQTKRSDTNLVNWYISLGYKILSDYDYKGIEFCLMFKKLEQGNVVKLSSKSGFKHFVRGVIKNKDNQILMLWQKKWNCWIIPGGKVEDGESFEEAMVREIQEETGIEITEKELKYVGDNQILFSDNYGYAKLFEVKYDGKYTNSEPEKHEKLGWAEVSKSKKNKLGIAITIDGQTFDDEFEILHSGLWTIYNYHRAKKSNPETLNYEIVLPKIEDIKSDEKYVEYLDKSQNKIFFEELSKFDRSKDKIPTIANLGKAVIESILAVQKDLTIKNTINFYDQEIRDQIICWDKTIETRALNPEEKARYFGDVLEGDILKFKLKKINNSKESADYIESRKMGLITTGYHLPYNPDFKLRSRELRKNMTKAEKKLWNLYFKDRKDISVARQKPLDFYIADFFIPSYKLIIEVDGDSHFTKEGIEYDKKRTKNLESYGLTVLRFTNEEIFNNFDGVCEKLDSIFKTPLPPFTKGGGDEGAGGFCTEEGNLLVQVKKNYKRENLEILFEDKDILSKIFPGKKFKTLKELEKVYSDLAPGYLEKIQKNGLIGREILPIKQDLDGTILPYFQQKNGTGALQNNKETVRRKIAVAILKYKEKYLLLNREKNGWFSFVGGGIEDGENYVDAGIREIQEETGYQNIKFSRFISKSFSDFFVPHKDQNILSEQYFSLYELIDEQKIDISKDELENHKMFWLDASEVFEKINLKDQKVVWDKYFEEEKYSQLKKGNCIIVNGASMRGIVYTEAEKKLHKARYNWLIDELNKIGISASNPSFDSNNPDYSERKKQMDTLEVNENTILIGHSAGFAFLTRRLSENKKKIKMLISVAGAKFIDVEQAKKYPQGSKKLEEFYNFEVDEKIKNTIGQIIYFIGEKEVERHKKALEYYHNKLGGEIIEIPGKSHFNWVYDKTIIFPELLNLIIEKINDSTLNTQTGKLINIPLLESDLPLTLPEVENYEPTGTTEGPLANITNWVNVTLPDGTKCKRETNTMPQRAGSSRYRLRFMDPKNNEVLVGKDKEKYRGEVDTYVGGAEHATRHLIYARFWYKFLYDIGVVTQVEPFKRLQNVGLVLAEDGKKISKRLKNGVDPLDVINEYGADCLRMYEMFMGPFDQAVSFKMEGVKGIKKFLERVGNLCEKVNPPSPFIFEGGLSQGGTATQALMYQTIKKVTEDIDEFKYNTAISQLMIFTNELTSQPVIDQKTFENLIILISPFAPHLAEELRNKLGNEFSIFTKAKWPTYDSRLLVSDTVNLAIQFNGKSRGVVVVGREVDQNKVLEIIKSDEKLNKYLTGEVKKIIYVKGKIMNVIV